MMNTENRVSPQAPEIEEAILGACLIEREAKPTSYAPKCFTCYATR